MATTYDALPIFPLPRLVLMPGALLPLHVFEPRYRELVAHCVDSDSPLAIATLRPGYEEHYDGSPPVYPEIGVGRLVRVQPMADGRSNIVLSHLHCARIVDEAPSERLFRCVRAEVLSLHTAGADRELAELRTMLRRVAGVFAAEDDRLGELLDLDDLRLTNELAAQLVHSPDARRQYIALGHLAERARVLTGHLAQALTSTMSPAEG